MNFVKYSAFYILVLMALLMVGSMRHDSATMDELAHIPAGFGYITQLDGRLNPEHPPLLKMISAFTANIIVHPYFPVNTTAWQTDINGQWDQGRIFLYESGNNADRIIFWSRIPVILFTLLLGALLWYWTNKRFGALTAFFTILFYAFSPTILAHGRYVTTDVAAAFGFFIGYVTFIRFLEIPSWKNMFLAGIAFGIAELLKFSLVLLLPLYGIMILAWVLTRNHFRFSERISIFFKIAGKTILIGVIGILVIWAVYIPLIIHYPQEKQYADAAFILQSYPLRPLANLDLALMKRDITRPLGQYLLGFIMVSQRAGGGNTGYFLGTVSTSGSRLYFPLLYVLKEPLPFHLLTLLALWVALRNWRKTPDSLSLREWVSAHFPEFSALAFIAIYWTTSVISPLNIGIRHVLPTFPFIYMLVARKLAEWIELHITVNPRNMAVTFFELARYFLKAVPKFAVLMVLLLWFAAGTVSAYPYFLSYYNELAGGTWRGYNIAVDSNYDWGQDLLRLRDFVQANNINTIAIDYFGGGNPKYYFGEKYVPWWSSKGPAHGWFAISATFEQGTFGTPAPGFIRKPEDSYEWLRGYEPVARAGTSIFIYNLP